MANKLRPFRDYSEHNVINLFSHIDGAVDDGIVVKHNANTNWGLLGWQNSDELNQLSMLGDVGSAYDNSVSERYGVSARVDTAGTADIPIGMTLYAVAETDENGEKLIYNPRKAAEMQVVVSGQALRIVTKGLFLYDVGYAADTVIVGWNARVGANGVIVTGGAGAVVGRWLGNVDANGHALLQLDILSPIGLN